MSVTIDSKARQAFHCVAERLLEERGPHGHWEGRLSTSALSTATAVFALTCVRRHRTTALPIANQELDRLIASGRDWIAAQVGTDGGWGDTVTSPSHLSTSCLCWAALTAEEAANDRQHAAIEKAEGYIRRHAGGLERDVLSRAVQDIYGQDKTFSVPILTMCALAGRLGPGEAPWRHIPALPFELAIFPRAWFKHLGLPVVSYALPALIAMGQTQHHHRPTRIAPLRFLRERSRRPTLELLGSVQPSTGGFLEAVPLTSFVTMSLAMCELPDSGTSAADHPVVDQALRFLASSVREDGSWPIDVNLATWGTTLSINALSSSSIISEHDREVVLTWLLGQQHLVVHPFTDAEPGGWAWTDLPGGVPDADDTSGALIALANLVPEHPEVVAAAARGVKWLLDLQNRDGGIPTFCRGWGSLPFDRSSPDISAHALRAWHAWQGRLPAPLARQTERVRRGVVRYLERVQGGDGSWVPLWFGNQFAPQRENPTYGTSRVVLALAEGHTADAARHRGVAWLLAAQNADGGWGGAPGVASSVEESALALEALAAVRRREDAPEITAAGERAVTHLLGRIEAGDLERPAPIGLYFADLWYSEKLYPWIFTAAALGRWLSCPR